MQSLECARNHRQPVEGQTTGVVATTVPKMQGCEVLTHSVSPSQATHTQADMADLGLSYGHNNPS